jgi:phage tail-like protein
MTERRDLPGLAVRTRIGEMLPAMFHDDDMAQRWCSGLDDVMAPVPSTLDNMWAYLDPSLAPLDFVEWLAGWVGLELDQTWDEARRRELVATAHRLYDYRGTARGLSDLIELYTGIRPEISDGGGVVWSATPDAALPSDDVALVVKLVVEDPEQLDRARLENMVELNKPAHITHRIEIESGEGPAFEPPKPDERTDDQDDKPVDQPVDEASDDGGPEAQPGDANGEAPDDDSGDNA